MDGSFTGTGSAQPSCPAVIIAEGLTQFKVTVRKWDIERAKLIRCRIFQTSPRGCQIWGEKEDIIIDRKAIDRLQDDHFHKISELVAEGMQEIQIPGGVLGILHEGQEQILGLGVTNIEHPLPVSPETLFQAGSITKTFTATAIMRLVEMNLIDLEQPLRTYLPGLRLVDAQATDQVTMKHLLTHTCGWQGDYFADLGRGEGALERMVDRIGDLPQITPIGEVWSYNNAAFSLAGRVIEVVTGNSYEEAIKDLVLDPLGLSSSYFFAEDVLTHRFAVGHNTRADGLKVARPWSVGRAIHPAGGLSSTAGDLLRYARFHIGDGTSADGSRVLSNKTLQQMQTPLFPATGLEMMGLSWFITEVDGQRMLEHPGGTNGQASTLCLVPQKGFAMVLMVNSDRGRRLVERVKLAALLEYIGFQLPEAVPVKVEPQKLVEYVGRYSATLQILDVKVAGDNLELNVTTKGGFPTPDTPAPPSPPPALMGYYGEDRAVLLEAPHKGERAEFIRDRSGQVKWLRLLGRIHTKEQ
ncbi:MAG: serine hydrolase domain-containing protein [Anaerolineales bacterium]